MHWPRWAKPCCWVGSTGRDSRGAKPGAMGAWRCQQQAGWTGQCRHWLTGSVFAWQEMHVCPLAASVVTDRFSSGFSLSLLLRYTSAFVVGGWMTSSAQDDWKARGWVEIVISFQMTSKNTRGKKSTRCTNEQVIRMKGKGCYWKSFQSQAYPLGFYC